MDKEFHYYLTYLIAARSGFPFDDALTIAQSCQAVDDNTYSLNINSDSPHTYSNYISQTVSLLKPQAERMRIYPVFHFIPGDSDYPLSDRADTKTHILNTTPNSTLANQCFDEASETSNLMQIGIASHAYADTWAHQNFVGYSDKFNELEGTVNKLIPNIGHADARHYPDWPVHIWEDSRLIDDHRIINNKIRFLDAAKHLYEKFTGILQKEFDATTCHLMLYDFDIALGRTRKDSNNVGKTARIDRYLLLSEKPEYNGRTLPEFEFDDWRQAAISTSRQINTEGVEETIIEWKHPQTHKETNWYQFQEAIKTYQKRTLEIYKNSVYSHLSTEKLNNILKFR